MSGEGVGRLHFLPWMRRGLARSLAQTAVDGAPPAAAGSIAVSVVVGDGSGVGDSDPIEQTIRLRGPGDVVGLNPTQVVRSDPPDGTQDFESNYFPCVELLAPDLPWMFVPAAAGDDGRLVPWLALVVVRQGDGVTLASKAGAPLPVLTIAEPADARVELPRLSEAWAWAHVQTSADLDATTVAEAWAASPEQFLARLVAPRRLGDNTRYIAAIVPTFEDGRRAGLGLAARDEVDTSDPDWWKAWTDGDGSVELPVYHSFSFKTGSGGDFEELVRRLTPRELDAGTHDLDVGDPGTSRLPFDPAGTIVSWKGALVGPVATVRTPEPSAWDALRDALRALVNEVDAGLEPGAGEPYDPLVHDPVVGAPAYGLLPVGADEVPAPVLDGESQAARHEPLWLAEANVDPTHRSAAGLGSEVVRRNQESLMAQAWQQATSLRAINRVLNRTRLAAEIGALQKVGKVEALSAASVVQLAAPAKARLRVGDGLTLAGRVAGTSLPAGLVSGAFRRVARPGGPLGRAVRATSLAATNPATAVTQACLVNVGGVLEYAAFVRPTGLQVGAEVALAGLPQDAAEAVGSTGSASARRSSRSLARGRAVVPALAVAPMPGSFRSGGAWSSARTRVVAATPAVRGQDELATLARDVQGALDPKGTLSAKLVARISAPGAPFAGAALPASLHASPEFPEPLYELLRRVSAEFLLPGVGEIPDDTVGLAYVHSAFVEAFLLGANHELGREFLWREYPADLTETWLRTFWDSIPREHQSVDTAIEDIGQVSGWDESPYTGALPLGAHPTGFGADGTLVLILKGSLLKKHPDTVIYASKGRWNADRTAREEDTDAAGAPVERRDPVFTGSLDRKTVFLGFELDETEALGNVDADGLPVPGDDGGWFFVFEEPPAGPRFGLDAGRPNQAGSGVDRHPRFWRNASWYHQVEAAADLEALSHAEATGRLSGSAARWYDDPDAAAGGNFEAAWGTDAADMARITLQRPVRMLVHASAMLPETARED